MKLSIITPVYKDAKNLEKFLEKMKEQKSSNYEIILVVDTNNDNTLKVIDEFKGSFKKKLKLVFNSKRSSRNHAIYLGAKHATGEYSIIMSLQNHFDNKFVGNAIDIINSKGTDVIEFRAKFLAPIKFDGKIRKAFNQSVNPNEVTEVHAFTYAFDFNKLFRTETLVQSSKYKLPVQLNSRFAIDVTFFTLLSASSYSTSNRVLVSSKSKISENFNPMKMIRQWESLSKLVKDYTSMVTTERYTYNQYFTEVVLISALTKATKNKVVSKKFNDKFKKQLTTTFTGVLDVNKYAIMKSAESRVLAEFNSVSQIAKAHKELG